MEVERKVTVKYGKETHEILLQEGDNFEGLQAKIYCATTVLPKNMKILNKGGKVSDDKSTKDIKDGAVLTIMGTKETGILSKIEIAVDTEANKPKVKQEERFGLENVGNTCYLNSCIQLITCVRELHTWLKNNPVPIDNYGFNRFTSDMSDTMRQLAKGTLKPLQLVANFLTMAPNFGPLGEQQDAEECWQKLMFFLNKVISVHDPKSNKEVSLIDRLFEIEYFETLSCPDLPDEKPRENVSTSRKLSCMIGGNPEVKINTLPEGINLFLHDTMSKKSDFDGKEHIYKRVSKISKLPPYLMVQEIRFFWKEANEIGGTKANATKIGRAVDFQPVLDLYEFCTDELKKTLKLGKDLSEKLVKKKEEDQQQEFAKYLENMPKDKFKDQKTAFREFKEDMISTEAARFDEDVYRTIDSGHPTGEYQLIGVATHMGQSVNSGHYMAWVHRTGKLWNKFDDDTVYDKKIEDVLGLRGGLANTEMAYVLLYRRRQVPGEQ